LDFSDTRISIPFHLVGMNSRPTISIRGSIIHLDRISTKDSQINKSCRRNIQRRDQLRAKKQKEK